MSTVGSNAFHIIAYILISMLFAYCGGRIHQWYMHSMDRDRSFREGYNNGYHSLFAVAARNTQSTPDLPTPIGQAARPGLPHRPFGTEGSKSRPANLPQPPGPLRHRGRR
jgi:hypothetical protein